MRFGIFDEPDRYKESAGTEGSPISLGTKRTNNFWNRLIILVSTPTDRGKSAIEREFELSNKQFFNVPCPHCEKYQRLMWRGVVWPKGRPEMAEYECEYCNKKWNDPQRLDAVRKGIWIVTNPLVTDIAGFHISEIYSPWSNLPRMAKEFLAAKKGGRETLKVFINTSLGETFGEGKKIEHAGLYERCEKYPAPVPAGGLVLVGSVDVQGGRLEGKVTAYGIGKESWAIERWVIYGDLSKDDIWEKELDEKLKKVYLHESGLKLLISCVTIDSGGHFTTEVYKFCKKREYRRIYAIKGNGKIGMPIIGTMTRNNKLKVPLFSVGTDAAKERIFNRLQNETPGPGYMHFPESYTEENFKQITAEKMDYRYHKGRPKREWTKTRERNEELDLTVYADAAIEILDPAFEVIAKKLEQKAVEYKKNPGGKREEKPPRQKQKNFATGFRGR